MSTKVYQKTATVSSVDAPGPDDPSGRRHRGAAPVSRPALPVPDRWLWAALMLGATTVLAASAWLSPAAAGTGTHLQLGLPPCSFLLATSLPCPGCGLTTSFAHMADLELLSALRVHPVGVLMFLLCLLCVPLAAVGLVRNLPTIRTLSELYIYQLCVGVAVLAMVHWFIRLAGIWLA